MPAHQLNPTAASLLGFLHEGPMTGWDLVTAAQERIGNFWSLTQSQVYRELTAMANAGLVKAGKPGPRDRKPYAITRAGRTAFARWLNQDPAGENIRFPLLVTILFAEQLPAGRLEEIVASQRAEHADRLAGYQKLRRELRGRPEVDRFRLAPLEFGIRYERALLAWFDQLPKIIAES
ncbi:MAG: PadR family transcriptional regulator [Sciscionella sp.]|nr:PadR family transcriptional regulator [Sciscionella sp.]